MLSHTVRQVRGAENVGMQSALERAKAEREAIAAQLAAGGDILAQRQYAEKQYAQERQQSEERGAIFAQFAHVLAGANAPDGSPAWIWPLAQARVDGTACCITVQASSTRTALFLLLSVEFAATATAARSHHVFTTSFISLFFNKGRWAKPLLSSSILSASQSHSPEVSAGAGPVEQQHRAKWFDFSKRPMPLVLASAAARRFFDDDCTTVSSFINPITSS